MFNKIIIGLLSIAIALYSMCGYSDGYMGSNSQSNQTATTGQSTQEVEKKTPSDRSQLPRGTVFSYEYVPPRDPNLKIVYDFAKSVDLLHKLYEVNTLDGMFMLPRPLRIVTAECKAVNAFYAPKTGEIVLCYEMISDILKQGDKFAKAKGYDSLFASQYMLANLRFIMLHEAGHALIDLLQLSAVGREEDAADQLAMTLMLLNLQETPEQIAANIDMVGVWFILNGSGGGQYKLTAYADEHSLSEQRYYNIMCMLYGRDPGKYLRIVTSGRLPESRAMRCPDESNKITRSWARLLLPHFAPRYQMTTEEGQAIVEKARREQATKAQSPYIRGD